MPQVEFAQTPAEARGVQQLRQRHAPAAVDDVGRRLQHQIAQQVGDDVEFLRIRVQPVRVLARELRDFRLRSAGADAQVAAILRRQKVRDLAFDDAQAVARADRGRG